LDGLLCGSIQAAAPAVISLSGFENFLVPSMSRYIIGCTWHFLLHCSKVNLIRQHLIYALLVALVNDGSLLKLPFALGGLLGKNMPHIRFHSLYLTGAGFFEPLGSRTICFQLRH
jgi:hypothetical protein